MTRNERSMRREDQTGYDGSVSTDKPQDKSADTASSDEAKDRSVDEAGTPDINAFEIRDDAVKLQYELLGIIDSKAAALLSFDAVALASLSIWLGYIPLNYMHFTLDVVFIMLLVSCLCLLMIISLRWATAADNETSLNAIRNTRTKFYSAAWKLSLSGIGAILVESIVHTYGTILIATDTCGSKCGSFYSEKVFGNLDYNP